VATQSRYPSRVGAADQTPLVPITVTPPDYLNYQVNFSTDYKGQPPTAPTTLKSFAWTNPLPYFQSDGKGGGTVTLGIDVSHSWVRPQVSTWNQSDREQLREHEQVHYDLAVLAVREFVSLAPGIYRAHPDHGYAQKAKWDELLKSRFGKLDKLYERTTGESWTNGNQKKWTDEIDILINNDSNDPFSALEQWAASEKWNPF
jgi:hypothetical protein